MAASFIASVPQPAHRDGEYAHQTWQWATHPTTILKLCAGGQSQDAADYRKRWKDPTKSGRALRQTTQIWPAVMLECQRHFTPTTSGQSRLHQGQPDPTHLRLLVFPSILNLPVHCTSPF